MRRLSGFLVGVLAITLLLTACGGRKSADAPTKLTVGYIPVMIDAPLYVGIEKRYFKDENLEITLAPLAGGTDIITQTATGNFDVGLGGLGVATFNALAKNIGIKVVAPLHSEAPPVTTPLVVSKKVYDSGQIKGVADLKGKKVAINAAGSATEYWLARARKGGPEADRCPGGVRRLLRCPRRAGERRDCGVDARRAGLHAGEGQGAGAGVVR